MDPAANKKYDPLSAQATPSLPAMGEFPVGLTLTRATNVAL